MSVVDVAVADEEDTEDEPAKKPISKELWFLVVVAIALALLLKTFLIQAFFIPSGSMEKTLHGCDGCSGDRVLVNKLVYRFRDIHRGEIVVFNGKDTNFSSETYVPPPRNVLEGVVREIQGALGLGASGDKDFIKRVIGVPGDVVACCTNDRVTVNGQELDEPYVHLTRAEVPQDKFAPVTVPDGHLFLMGDHRDGSSDSRYNGTVPIDNVVGRAFVVFWPMGRQKVLGVPETFSPPAAAAAPYVLGFAMAVPVTVVRRRLRG